MGANWPSSLLILDTWQDKKKRCCPVSGRPIDHDPRSPAVRHFFQYSVRHLLGPYRASDFDSGTQNCDHQLVKKKYGKLAHLRLPWLALALAKAREYHSLQIHVH